MVAGNGAIRVVIAWTKSGLASTLADASVTSTGRDENRARCLHPSLRVCVVPDVFHFSVQLCHLIYTKHFDLVNDTRYLKTSKIYI